MGLAASALPAQCLSAWSALGSLRETEEGLVTFVRPPLRVRPDSVCRQALKLDASNHVLYSRRSECSLCLHGYDRALADARR